MVATVTIKLERPIKSAEIADDFFGIAGTELSEDTSANPRPAAKQTKLTQEKVELSQICRTLGNIVSELNQFRDKIFAEHRESIARLSVEIARKILMQKVLKGDYEIESIVKEVLKNAPAHQDVVVHLNPDDIVQCQKLQQGDTADALSGIKFIADSNIGRAECLLETPKGVIESLIDKHLEQIGKALEKVE